MIQFCKNTKNMKNTKKQKKIILDCVAQIIVRYIAKHVAHLEAVAFTKKSILHTKTPRGIFQKIQESVISCSMSPISNFEAACYSWFFLAKFCTCSSICFFIEK